MAGYEKLCIYKVYKKMRLYHYTTWDGEEILKTKTIKPTKLMGSGEGYNSWPSLVFLTTMPSWNIATDIWVDFNKTGNIPKEGTSPETLTKLGIPAWRFEVELKEPLAKLMYPHPMWLPMLNIAKGLGADLSTWHWVRETLTVIGTKHYGY